MLSLRRCGASPGLVLATILFGISRSMVLSMVALMLVGATDMVSVVIRGILIQLVTPNDMRGRVQRGRHDFYGHLQRARRI